MSEDHVVSFSLELNVEPTKKHLREVLALTDRWFGLLHALDLPPEQKAQIAAMREIIQWINRVRLAYRALAAETPLGLILAAISLGEMVGDVMGGVNDATRGNML